MGLIDRLAVLLGRNREIQSTPAAPTMRPSFKTGTTGQPSRRATAKKKAARKRSKESRRRNR